MRDHYRGLRQEGMSVWVYVRRVTKLSLFAPKDVAINVIRVGRFRCGLRDKIRFLCRSPQPFSYMELLSMALGVENDHTSTRKSIAAIGGFSGKAASRPMV